MSASICGLALPRRVMLRLPQARHTDFRLVRMDVTRFAALPEVLLVTPKRFGDNRGFFSETYNRRLFADHGLDLDFVQDNHSLSAAKGTLRGFHYQLPPFAQGKLVRVVKGAILDAAVDIRHGSPTFGQSVTAEITADNWRQIWVPPGFAHGFVTLAPDTEVIYKVTGFYSAPHDRGIIWNDPDIGLDWGVDERELVLSEKDRKLPRLAEAEPAFTYAPGARL